MHRHTCLRFFFFFNWLIQAAEWNPWRHYFLKTGWLKKTSTIENKMKNKLLSFALMGKQVWKNLKQVKNSPFRWRAETTSPLWLNVVNTKGCEVKTNRSNWPRLSEELMPFLLHLPPSKDAPVWGWAAEWALKALVASCFVHSEPIVSVRSNPTFMSGSKTRAQTLLLINNSSDMLDTEVPPP